jgi:hypothetical protein
MSYQYSSKHYSSLKPIVHHPRYDTYHTRESSTDSHGSYYSRSSAEYSSRSGSGYGGSADQRAYEESKRNSGTPVRSRATHYPTNNYPSTDRYYSSSKRDGKADTVHHHHHKVRYDEAEPRSSDATYAEYKSTQSRSSKSSSSHKKKK